MTYFKISIVKIFEGPSHVCEVVFVCREVFLTCAASCMVLGSCLFLTRKNVTLKQLWLQNNAIGDEGRDALRKVLGGLLIECT